MSAIFFSGDDKLHASDAEDILEQIEDDNKVHDARPRTPSPSPSPAPDPPDKTLDDTTANISKITVVWTRSQQRQQAYPYSKQAVSQRNSIGNALDVIPADVLSRDRW